MFMHAINRCSISFVFKNLKWISQTNERTIIVNREERDWYFFIVLVEFFGCLRRNVCAVFSHFEFMRWLTRILREDILAFHHIESKRWRFFLSSCKTGVRIQRLSIACSMNCSESFSTFANNGEKKKRRDNYTKWNETKYKKKRSTHRAHVCPTTMHQPLLFLFLLYAYIRRVLNTLNAIFIVL